MKQTGRVTNIDDLHGREFSSKRRRNQRFVGQTLVCPRQKLSAIPGLKRADPGQRAWQKNRGKKNEQSSLFPFFLSPSFCQRTLYKQPLGIKPRITGGSPYLGAVCQRQ